MLPGAKLGPALHSGARDQLSPVVLLGAANHVLLHDHRSADRHAAAGCHPATGRHPAACGGRPNATAANRRRAIATAARGGPEKRRHAGFRAVLQATVRATTVAISADGSER